MFDLPNDGDYDRWLNVFTEASARLDALETAVTDVRQLLRDSADVNGEDILKVFEKIAYNHSSTGSWNEVMPTIEAWRMLPALVVRACPSGIGLKLEANRYECPISDFISRLVKR